MTALIIIIGLYFLPTIVAVVRRAPNAASVAVVDIFLGWTVIGWIIALAMAVRDRTVATDWQDRRP